jgi:hypothetical protein
MATPVERQAGSRHSPTDEAPKARPAPTTSRITVNISQVTEQALHKLVEREGVTLTEALRRLVAYGDVIYTATQIEGKHVLLRDGDELQQVLLV